MVQRVENTQNRVAALHNAACLENAAAMCTEHTAALIKNGKIRQHLSDVSDAAKQNRQWLIKLLNEAGTEEFAWGEKCAFCKLDPETFSLDGAISLCLELTEGLSAVYKQLSGYADDEGNRETFLSLLKEKTQTRDFLKKEKNFSRKGSELSLIDSFCIPHISKLLK
jgi:rubrerythrin